MCGNAGLPVVLCMISLLLRWWQRRNTMTKNSPISNRPFDLHCSYFTEVIQMWTTHPLKYHAILAKCYSISTRPLGNFNLPQTDVYFAFHLPTLSHSTPIDRTRDVSYSLFYPYRQDMRCVVFFIPPLSTGHAMCRIFYSTPIDRTRDVSYS